METACSYQQRPSDGDMDVVITSESLKVDHEVEIFDKDSCQGSLEAMSHVCLGCDTDHSKFIRRDEYTIDNLPEEIRHWSVDGILRLNSDLTARVEAPPSPNEKYPKTGSCSICYFSDTHNLYPCPHGDVATCNLCHIPNCPFTQQFGPDHYIITNYVRELTEEEKQRAHLAFRVSTSKHVVASSLEAARTKVELFFDSENTKDGVVTAQGVCLCGHWKEQDKVHIVCVSKVVPRLQELLQSMRDTFKYYFNSIPADIKQKLIEDRVILVSHPHGYSKRISLGRNLWSEKKFSRSKTPYTETHYEVESCRGSSGGVVLGPGWVDGGPSYRVHCGRVGGSKVSKSFWVVAKDGVIDLTWHTHKTWLVETALGGSSHNHHQGITADNKATKARK